MKILVELDLFIRNALIIWTAPVTVPKIPRILFQRLQSFILLSLLHFIYTLDTFDSSLLHEQKNNFSACCAAFRWCKSPGHLKLAQLRSQIPLFVEKQADFIFLRPEGPIVHFLETILGQRTKYFHFLSTFLHRIIRRPNSKHDLEKTMRGKFLEKPTVHNCRSLDKIKIS